MEYNYTMRMRRKPKLEMRIENCAHLLINDPQKLRGCWLNEFNFKELHIEIGCGKGSFTAITAKRDPGILLVALEKTANVIVVALERTAHEELRNVRYINAFADGILQFFAKCEVSRIYINFCDPWPANRHVKRRLTGQYFLDLYKQVLKPGGEIHFKTDNMPLFEFSLREFERCGFAVTEVVRDLHKHGIVGVMTDYEAKFHGQGKPIYQCKVRIL